MGECMVELRASGDDTFARSYAGDVYNTAVYLKRSLPEARVQFLSATGDDPMSAAMRHAWRAEGIDDTLAFTVTGGTPGLYLIETDHQGERRFYYWRSASAARRWLAMLQRVGEDRLWGADQVYLSGIALAILTPQERTLAIEMLKRLRGHVGQIAFDPNFRLSLWESAEVAAPLLCAAMAASDTVLPSYDDLTGLFGAGTPEEHLRRLLDLGVAETALTMGSEGCVLADRTGTRRLFNPPVAQVVDTSGAGDAFNGSYLATRLRGRSPADAAEAGLAVAARVVTRTSAIVAKGVSHPTAVG